MALQVPPTHPRTSSSSLTTLITGASSGIGLALAHRFARSGHPLVLVGRDAGRLAAAQSAICAKYEVPVTLLSVDLSRPEAASQLLESCDQHGLQIDVLVNNAGVAIRNDRQLVAPQELREMLQLNVVTLSELCCRFGLRMCERGVGYMLNVSSMTAFVGASSLIGYGPSKRYVLAYTRELAEALAPAGVRVSCLVPGLTETGFFGRSGLHLNRVEARKLGLMSADEVAALGYEHTFKGSSVRICGGKNRLLARLSALLPKTLIDQRRQRIHGCPPAPLFRA